MGGIKKSRKYHSSSSSSPDTRKREHNKSSRRKRESERNGKKISRSRSNSKDKNSRKSEHKADPIISVPKHILEIPKTQEELEKERKRKIQMRLAKARALKYQDNSDEESKPSSSKGKHIEKVDLKESSKESIKGLPDFPPILGKKKLSFEEDYDLEELNPISTVATSKFSFLRRKNEEVKEPVEMEIEEEDPLEAYMKEIQGTAAKQETFQFVQKNDRTFFKTENDASDREYDESKVITFDEIINNGSTSVNEDKNDEETDELFHNEFLKVMNQKKEEERLRKEQFMEFQKRENDTSNKKVENDILTDDEIIDYVHAEEMGYDDDYFSSHKKNPDKKELKNIDHNKVKYTKFKKNFYIQTKEVAQMTDDDIKKIRLELGDIKIRGVNCPNPIMNWFQSGLPDKILDYLTVRRGYKEPFAIQCQCLPAIMSGRDVIGIAETGSGKTLAYLLPMLRHILDQRKVSELEGPIALVMAPTRELTHQIYREVKGFSKAVGIRCVCVYGGSGIAAQLSDLKKGAEIVVCTPGRMIDVLCTSNGKITNLTRVTYVVIDEADRMFDLGFEPQINKIMDNVRPDRQTVLFSATFPKNVEILAKKVLFRPLEIIVGSRGKVCSNVTQFVEVRDQRSKFYRLLELLGHWNEKGNILIFVDKQIEADDLFKELLKHGYYTLVIHGGQDQTDREYTLIDYKKGVRNILIATSVCARGLDISTIVLVVNFKCPNHMEDYIHRVGRTGRAGNKGTAITFLTEEDEACAPDIIKVLKMSQQEVPSDLEELANLYYQKVKSGEAKWVSNRNLVGTGYKFDEEEQRKLNDFKAAFKRQFDIELRVDEVELSDEEILKKKKKNEKDDEKDQIRQEKEALQMIKDPSAKAAILSEATKAAKDAILAGGNSEEVLQAAANVIKNCLGQYKPNANTVEKGLERAIKVVDDIIMKEEEKGDFIVAEFEINDYPQQARSKVLSKDYLNMIRDLTNCNVSIRGTIIETGKKPKIGEKKLYLYIQGDTKYNVASAYREIQKLVDEISFQAATNGYNQF